MESLPFPKQNRVLESKEEYPKMSVKQLTQWISNTKILFKTNRSHKNNNRKITEYFGKDSARKNNISTKDMLNKTRSSEDNNNRTIHSNNYLGKEWVSTSGKNITDHSNNREDKKSNYSTDPTSILPPPTETKTIFGNNKAERINSKKHQPVQQELLDKTNSHSKKK